MKNTIGMGILLLGAVAAFSAEDYSHWTSYKDVTINTSSSGANVTGNVAQFPVLVRLTSGTFNGFSAAGTRNSIRFARGALHLPYEIERWDSAGQVAEIWVLADTVFGNNAAQTLRMYWGNAAAADSSNGGAVFTSANGYVGAWHLGNTTGINARPNSVSGAPPATPTNDGGSFGGGAGTYVIPNGVIGKADVLRGGGSRTAPAATSDYLDLGDVPPSTSSPFSGNNTYNGYTDFSTGFTYSFWVNPGTANGNYSYMLELSNGDFATDNIQFFRPTTATTYRYENTNGGTSGGTVTTATGSLVVGTWQYITVTVGTGSTPAVTIYKNGASSVTGTETLPITTILRANAWIGKSNYDGDAYFVGSFDEPEISNVVRSADWIKLSYQTQFTGSTVVTLGATVNPPPTNLTYHPNPAVYTVGYAIPANTPTVTGVVTHYSVAPALPGGLSLDTVTGVISGTPTTPAAASVYVVSASNVTGSDTESVTITVNPALVAPTGLSYSTSTAVYGTGTAITPNTPTVTGTVTGYSVSPTLPAGLTLNTTTGVISGTPTAAAAAANYTVTASNTAGSTTAVLNITVLAPPSGLSYSTPAANYAATHAITPNTPTVTGTASSYSVSPALPAGLTLNTTTGVISGTPTTAQSATNYTVTASNTAGSTTVVISIAIIGPPSGLYYAQDPVAYTQNQAIFANSPTVTGTVTRYSISPPLPAGLVMDTLTGTITGTPTVATSGYVNDTVTASNVAGSTTAILSIWVMGTIAIVPGGVNGFLFHPAGLSPLSFSLPAGANPLRLSIVDVGGHIVWSRHVNAGTRELSWNGVMANGRSLVAGLYVVQMKIVDAKQQTSVLEKKISYSP